MIKRWFGVLLVFGFILMTCASCGRSNRAATMVILGNSLTAGHGAVIPGEDNMEKSVPAFLQSKINIPIINAGVSGNTTAQGFARVSTDVLPHNPRIVIIELGANDLLQNVPLPEIHENLQKIIDLVNDGNRKIFLVKFYTDIVARNLVASLFNLTDYDQQTAVINQYEEMFNTLAASNNAELIDDIWTGVWGIHMSDHMHPDERGYRIMADNYFNALKPYLQANNLLTE